MLPPVYPLRPSAATAATNVNVPNIFLEEGELTRWMGWVIDVVNFSFLLLYISKLTEPR